MSFKSDSLMCIVRHDVLKHFLLCQDVTILTVALKPESRSLMVKVICYAEIVHSHSFNVFICFNHCFVAEIIFRHIITLSEYVIWNWLLCLFLFLLHCCHHVFHITNFFFLLFCFRFTSNVWYQLCIHVNDLFLLSGFWIYCFGPSITKINFCNALSGVFNILYSSGAWNFLGD